ncbi:MAG: KOW domain-containing RNA-binding protein [Oscillospiraceae bacterium]|nr:hypothetical protein [Ruminococcus sp.]MBQ7002645.1 KOW domain-containing RNA-binding protein [Oscillospiraceae bacterium]MBQ7013998.1 KOW domain-containing RNA-binding protein [Oscillospiraceae bacterium]
MQLTEGMVVCATAGKEKGSFMVVTQLDGNAVYLADGKHRTLNKPKRKNVKHIQLTRKVLVLEGLTDRALRRKLQERDAQLEGI